MGVRAAGLVRRFGPVEALRGLDLEAAPGRITALVGPNGAGKTTLLLILASLLRPDAGAVRIGDLDPIAAPREARDLVGWSPDVFGVYDNLTPHEYLTFFGRGYLMSVARARSRASELVHDLRLEPLAGRPVHTLSRGQKQLLGLGRALVHRPRVLLLDEPASGLDPRHRIVLRDLLLRLAAEGVTVLVSSHVLSDLEDLADAAVFVDGGRTVSTQEMRSIVRGEPRPWAASALDPDRLVTTLRRLGRESSPQPDGRVLVEVTSAEDAAELLGALVAGGARVTEFGPAGGALEAAYLRLTEERA